jgi:hypothetical protein
MAQNALTNPLGSQIRKTLGFDVNSSGPAQGQVKIIGLIPVGGSGRLSPLPLQQGDLPDWLQR